MEAGDGDGIEGEDVLGEVLITVDERLEGLVGFSEAFIVYSA